MMSMVATAVLRSRGGTEVRIGDDQPFAVIGERINPTGRTRLAEELKQGIFDTVVADAVTQVEAGARVLDPQRRHPGVR